MDFIFSFGYLFSSFKIVELKKPEANKSSSKTKSINVLSSKKQVDCTTVF